MTPRLCSNRPIGTPHRAPPRTTRPTPVLRGAWGDRSRGPGSGWWVAARRSVLPGRSDLLSGSTVTIRDDASWIEVQDAVVTPRGSGFESLSRWRRTVVWKYRFSCVCGRCRVASTRVLRPEGRLAALGGGT